MARSQNTKAADPEAVDEQLVPVKMLVSDAGKGIRLGEIRGFGVSIAKQMIEKKHAHYVDANGEEADKPYFPPAPKKEKTEKPAA